MTATLNMDGDHNNDVGGKEKEEVERTADGLKNGVDEVSSTLLRTSIGQGQEKEGDTSSEGGLLECAASKQLVLSTTKRKKKSEFSIYKLPEEVWELILDEVKDVKDKESCCRASTFFDVILTKSKPVWQFRKVLINVLGKHLPTEDQLNCRLVCQQWNSDIDHMFQRIEPDPFLVGVRNSFRSLADIDACLQQFESHPSSRNPFLDRALDFSNDNGDDEWHFLAKIHELVEKFGKHVWHLDMSSLRVNPLEFYMHLRKVMMNTPNLRQLNVGGFLLDMDGWTEEFTRMMSEAMLLKPLPFLHHLKSLYFRPRPSDCFITLPTMILLPYLPQLKNLSISMNFWVDIYSEGLVNLESGFFIDVGSDDALAKLLELNAPLLNDIKIIFTESSQISFSMLIKVLCKFPLEVVNLIMHDGAEFVDRDGGAAALIGRMRNTKLKWLQISHGPKFSYDFLRVFPSLEKLFVGLSGSLETYVGVGGWQEGKEDLQLYRMMWGEAGQPYRSNVWTELPKLEEVNIDQDRYENGMWSPLFQYQFSRGGYLEYRMSMLQD